MVLVFVVFLGFRVLGFRFRVFRVFRVFRLFKGFRAF